MAGRTLRPRQTKFTYMFERWSKPPATTEALLRLGDYGLQVIDNQPKRMGSFHMSIKENALVATQARLIKILRESDKGGKRRVKSSYTRKPAETKMGKGKGNVAGWVAVPRRGQVIFEWTSPPENLVEVLHYKIEKQVRARLGLTTQLIHRPKFKPITPAFVEEEMERRKALREAGEYVRPTYIPSPRRSNALEEYISELPEEEQEAAVEWFGKGERRNAFKDFDMDGITGHDWDIPDESA